MSYLLRKLNYLLMTLEFLKIYCNSLLVSFKNLRNIIQKLQKEATSADQTTIITALSLLELDQILATQYLAR
ncbi:hypothetical protein BC938DRAFT_477249 [Jimgerdemannia flammicorona]|uniref:Uncharacterized protein n=1 Tax=Jimgerdemannia flammicorona TaxID=994334 RepID=A0A433QPM2_9FUNG|nr:hypothetical protein BC938DRAFT_477249 [Jimgerdemannia flammicorona]